MRDSDKIMSIFNSITPIKYAFSKRNRQLNIAFKNKSLEKLKKNLNCHLIIKDEYFPAPEFLKNKNKYEINFKNSYSYIKELSDISNLPIFANNKNYSKKGSFNKNLDFNFLNQEEEEDNKIFEEKERRKKELFWERLQRLNYLKKNKEDNNDSLKYNPNFNFIKKKIYSVYIRPPTPNLNIKKKKVENKENKENNESNEDKENEKYTDKKKKKPLNIFKEYVLGKKQIKNRKIIKLHKNKKVNSSVSFSNRNQNNKHNSIIFHESFSILSNSNKNQFIDYNKSNDIQPYSSRNNPKLKDKFMISKNALIKNYEYKNSITNSDCFSIEINKSTNNENLSSFLNDKNKLYNSNSLRDISKRNIILPRIKTILRKNYLKDKTQVKNEIKNEIKNDIKNSIYFEKMTGRKDIAHGKNNNNSISYEPNFEFFRPHIQSSIFRYKINDENYKKYKTGKNIRGYDFSREKYTVYEYKKKEPKKFDLNRERMKILETLRKKIE